MINKKIFSKEANECIENFKQNMFETKKVFIDCCEVLDHDGYDEDGPQSDLWDLYIIFLNEHGEKKVDYFHREDWYDTDTDIKYIYCEEYDISILKKRFLLWELVARLVVGDIV